MQEKSKPVLQARHWCLTINNWTDVEKAQFLVAQPLLDYWIYGEEIAPETGTPHLQAYVCFKNQKRLSAVKKVFPTAHLEVKRGTVKQAVDYCKEDGKFTEWGEMPEEQTSKATRVSAANWEDTKAKAVAGDLEAIDAEHFIKYYPSLKRIRSDYRLKRKPVILGWQEGHPPNIWYYGKPGIGKSCRARTDYPDAYIKAPQNKWWGGYDDEKFVLIDDLRLDHHFQLSNLITWSDRYPFQAEIKLDTTGIIRPEAIILTSNFHPNEIWHLEADIDSILRRFKIVHIVELEKFDVPRKKKPKLVRQDADLVSKRLSSCGCPIDTMCSCGI